MTLYFKFERQTLWTLWKGIPAHIYKFLKFWLKNWKWMDLIPKIWSHKSLKKTKKWNIHMTTSKTSWSWKWWQLFTLSNRRNFLYSLDYLLYLAAANFGPFWRVSLTHPMLNCSIIQFQPGSHWEPCSEVGSLSPRKHLLGFEPEYFLILSKCLNLQKKLFLLS